jgi:hypothetical protein
VSQPPPTPGNAAAKRRLKPLPHRAYRPQFTHSEAGWTAWVTVMGCRFEAWGINQQDAVSVLAQHLAHDVTALNNLMQAVREHLERPRAHDAEAVLDALAEMDEARFYLEPDIREAAK